MLERFLVIALCMLYGLCALNLACESHTRKSKPPVKITDPNDIKRKDICYDRERRADKGLQYYVQAKT